MSTTKRWKVLVLSAGDNTGIGYCRSLKLAGDKYQIVATDTNPYRLHHSVGDVRYLLPEAASHDYFPSLLRLVQAERPDFLYASDTNPELEIVTSRRTELGCTTFWPPQDAMAIYEDKWLTYLKCRDVGVPVPETVLVSTPEDVRRAVRQWGKVWLRATRGSGGRGAIVTDDPDLGIAWVKRFDGWGTFTAAEVLTSEMATWMGIWWHGELVVGQGRKRLHWEYGHLSPTGVTGITGAQSTLKDTGLRETAIMTIKAMGHEPHGIVAVDFTYNKQGWPNPTEVQAARFYSSILFLAEAGLNLPDIYTELGLSGEPPQLPDRLDPLDEGLLWLKAVDCTPQLTTWDDVRRNESKWRNY